MPKPRLRRVQGSGAGHQCRPSSGAIIAVPGLSPVKLLKGVGRTGEDQTRTNVVRHGRRGQHRPHRGRAVQPARRHEVRSRALSGQRAGDQRRDRRAHSAAVRRRDLDATANPGRQAARAHDRAEASAADLLPDVPTAVEFAPPPELFSTSYYGYLAPKGTPPAIVARLNSRDQQDPCAAARAGEDQAAGREFRFVSPSEDFAKTIETNDEAIHEHHQEGQHRH